MDTTSGLEIRTPPQANGNRESGDGHVLLGAALILLGLAFLADQADVIHVTISERMWPFIPLFFGLVRLFAPGYRHGRRRPRRGAVWLLSIGLYGLVSQYRLFGLDYSTSWPLLIVAVGLNMVLKSFDAPCARAVREN
jgi:hypothetical protein